MPTFEQSLDINTEDPAVLRSMQKVYDDLRKSHEEERESQRRAWQRYWRRTLLGEDPPR